MRKIYSLVLMTAMLFIGTNAWADDVHVTGNTGEALQAVINTAPTNSRIVLDDNIAITPGKPIWVGTLHAYVNEGGNESATGTEVGKKSLTLDLNGHDITCTANANSQYLFMFMLSHGELIVTNSVSGTGGRIIMQAGSKSIHENSAIFSIFGSYKASNVNTEAAESLTDGLFSHLVIDEGVKLIGRDGAGITVDVARFEGSRSWYQLYHAPNKDNLYGVTFPATDNYGYLTSVSNDGTYYGFAFGVRVDLKGDISMGGVDSQEATTKAYCFKTNGILRDPMHDQTLKPASGHYAFLTGCPNPTENDRQNVPFIHIHSSATLKAPGNSTGAAAIYSSGYAKYVISGNCEGATGVYVKSGDIELNDATITSTYTGDETTITGGTSGIKSGGNGIVIESNNNYSGAQSVTVNGDTKVTTTATGGAAIVDVVDETNNSKIENITINGGTLTGDNAIVISSETAAKADEGGADVEVAGVSVIGTVTVGNLSGSDALGEIMSSNTHTTIVDNTVIISAGGEPTGVTDWTTVGDGDDVNVNYTGTAAITIGDGATATTRTLGELQLISGTLGNEQVLTVNNKATLMVERLILNSYARIIVEAGGKLVVKGDQGINAPVPANIVLKSTATKKATFIISDKVNSNKQPNATVEFTTTARQTGANTWQWQRFTTPMTVTSMPSHNGATIAPEASSYWTGSALQTYVDYMDDATTSWQHMNSWAKVRAFNAYAITNNLKPEVTSDLTYTFTGKLMGNVTDSIRLRDTKWNYFGNTYMAPMGTRALLAKIVNQPGVDGSIYLWDMETQTVKSVNSGTFVLVDLGIASKYTIDSIPAMGFFIVKSTTNSNDLLEIDYKNSIYNYTVNAPAGAPARVSENLTALRIDMQSENGVMDHVYLLESNDYSAVYDNSFDAEKYMNDNMSIYVAEEDMNYSMFASDNILGAMISLQTKEDINYTLTFSNVHGEVYALRDNLTNAVVLMNEGATYNFTAQPNATLDGRFQIVSRQEMPTAVETVEEIVNAPKAVYTIMGQYVGETTDWNNLPAGVYVVDGAKIVK